MPKISVIVPVYNVEMYIARCINSILDQTFQNFEIILVNDKSPDNSMAIANDFCERDPRIIIIENEGNSGLMWTRKVGYNAAKGDFFVFCDSDDWLPNTALQDLYESIYESDYDIVMGNFVCADNNGNTISVHTNELNHGNDRISVLKSLLRRECYHSMWGKIYRRWMFEDSDFGTQKHFTNSEDLMVFYQLVLRARMIGTVDSIVYNYFQNAASSSKVVLKERAIECMAIANRRIYDIIIFYPELVADLQTYMIYTSYSWILLGSRNYFMTYRILRKYNLEKYISIACCFRNCQINIFYLKILIKTMFKF